MVELTFAIPDEEHERRPHRLPGSPHPDPPEWERLLIAKDFSGALDSAHRAAAQVPPPRHGAVRVLDTQDDTDSSLSIPLPLRRPPQAC